MKTQDRIDTVRDIFHPTDFSPPSMAAFAHALKLTIGTRADLTIMHVDPDRAEAASTNCLACGQLSLVGECFLRERPRTSSYRWGSGFERFVRWRPIQ